MVVTFRTGPVLFDCLDALMGEPEITEVVVVDNGNPERHRQRLDALAADQPRVRIVRPGRNTGFAAGCNIGAAVARGTYVAFVNPDCVVAPGTLARVLDAFEAVPGTWICGARLQNPDGTEQRGGRRHILSPWRSLVELLRLDRLFPGHPAFRRLHMFEDVPIDEVAEVPTVSGAFMMLPKDRYESLGGMDDHMFLHFDDADLCLRALQAGGKVVYCGTAPVTHHLSTSDVSRTFIEWHKTRSTSYYFRKHFQGTYPSWAISLVAGLLWLRFGLKVLPDACRDLVRLARSTAGGR